MTKIFNKKKKEKRKKVRIVLVSDLHGNHFPYSLLATIHISVGVHPQVAASSCGVIHMVQRTNRQIFLLLLLFTPLLVPSIFKLKQSHLTLGPSYDYLY